MPQHRKLLYVIADGGSARLLERRRGPGAFVTLRHLDGKAQLAAVREEQRDEQAGRSMESATTARHAVGREDDYRRAKSAFARRTAETVKAMLADGAWSGVVLVAPPRLLRVLREELDSGAAIVHALAKDLTKTPEHELPRWLDRAELLAR